mgnify:CR=1 FL=1
MVMREKTPQEIQADKDRGLHKDFLGRDDPVHPVRENLPKAVEAPLVTMDQTEAILRLVGESHRLLSGIEEKYSTILGDAEPFDSVKEDKSECKSTLQVCQNQIINRIIELNNRLDAIANRSGI